MKQVSIGTKDFLFHSSLLVRSVFICSVVTFSLSLLLFIVFLAMGRVYKDIFGKSHYQVRYRQIDTASLSVNIISLVCLIILVYQYIRIFRFQKSGVLMTLITLIVLVFLLLGAQIVFLVINFCNDPEKEYNDYGKCVCKNNLIEINGKCSCPFGTYRYDDYCLNGCRTADDCQGGGDCIGGFCCPSPYVKCDNQCCFPTDCDDETGVCCGSNDRQCFNPQTGKTECCPPQTTCIDNACVSVCGPPDKQFFCTDGETCLQVNGDKDSLQAFQSSFPPEQKSVIQDGTLYTCAKPPSCSLQSTPVFIPPSISNEKVTFYPCYRNGEWAELDSSKVKSEDDSTFAPLQLNICVPKDVNAPQETYQACWTKIRDGTDNNIYNCQDDNCDLINILKIDYINDTDTTQKVNRAIKYEFLKTDDKGDFRGNYCGDGAVRIRSVQFSDQCQDVQDRGHATLQGGIFNNSRYVYFDDKVCNTYFDCTESGGTQNTDFFASYTYNDKKKDFPPFSLPQTVSANANSLVDYLPTCPSDCTPVDKKVWPDSTNYCECPGDLSYIESERTGDESKWVYDTFLCSNTGYVVHQKLNVDDLVCNDSTSCRPRQQSDNIALRDFSDDQQCRDYCQDVIFTNTWYTVSMCSSANCDTTATLQMKFDVTGDFSGQVVPVIAQTDHYDISVKKNDGSPLTVEVGRLSGSARRSSGDRFLQNARVFYIKSKQSICPSCSATPCACGSGTVGDGPNDSQPNRELVKGDRFVIGYGTSGDYRNGLYWYLGGYVESSTVPVLFNPWSYNCDDDISTILFAGTCDRYDPGDASAVEKYYLRFA